MKNEIKSSEILEEKPQEFEPKHNRGEQSPPATDYKEQFKYWGMIVLMVMSGTASALYFIQNRELKLEIDTIRKENKQDLIQYKQFTQDVTEKMEMLKVSNFTLEKNVLLLKTSCPAQAVSVDEMVRTVKSEIRQEIKNNDKIY